jgi:hypothetical protein
VSASLTRRVRELLREIAVDPATEVSRATTAATLCAELGPRRGGKTPAERKATSDVYLAVEARAAGRCEACGSPFDERLHAPKFDHWLGGSGRRAKEQRVETCWMLGWICERARTHNRPSAAYWNRLFEEHCKKHGYRFVPHVEHRQVKRRA